MRKIKDVLRLHLAGGMTRRRQLARVVGCGKMAVSDCLMRAQVAGLTDWLVVAALEESELEERLYPTQANSTLKEEFGIYRRMAAVGRSSPQYGQWGRAKIWAKL